MKRTLMLDEDDLIMVVKEDVVKQIDEHRGEMNRTEFVNYLIQCQLREAETHNDYISVKEFKEYNARMQQAMRNILEYCITSGTEHRNRKTDIQSLRNQIEMISEIAGLSHD